MHQSKGKLPLALKYVKNQNETDIVQTLIDMELKNLIEEDMGMVEPPHQDTISLYHLSRAKELIAEEVSRSEFTFNDFEGVFGQLYTKHQS